MNQCVLVVLLEYGHFMQLPMSEIVAKQIIDAWSNGEVSDKVFPKNAPPGQMWCFDIKRVVGMHLQNPQQQQYQYKNPFGSSGQN